MGPEVKAAVSGVKDIRLLFEPKSIAVVGASRRKEAVGYAIMSNLVAGGYQGKIYPVNPKTDKIGEIKCYPAIADIPETPELAIFIIPSSSVPQSLKECGEKGVRAAVIISAGFREIGGEGIKLEQEVAELAKQYNIPVMGPNCLGVINTDPRFSMNASFSRAIPAPGNIAFVSQSGALCTAILDYARGQNIGFSKFISVGNKADVNELDILRYLGNDPETDVILMYVEDLVKGREFIELAREITGDLTKPKPILAIKSGRTLAGAKAAQSHTGSLMGSDEVYDALFLQAGVFRVDSVEEMFDLGVAFANQPLPKGKRTAIVTNAGGPGIMATDACVRCGLEMATISPATIEALKKVLPPTSNFSNPIDVIGDAQHDRYEYALKQVVKDPNVDSIFVILTPQAMTEIEETAKVVVDIDQATEKTLVASFMGGVDVAAGVKILENNFVPHYTFPEGGAQALSAMVRYQKWIDRPRTEVKKFRADTKRVRTILNEVKSSGRKALSTYEAMEVFEAYGFPVLPYALANSETEAASKAKEIGFPIVMKVVASQIVHKFDVGGVKLNLKNAEEVKTAFREMKNAISEKFPKAKIDGMLIQKMAKPGREVILGMNRDQHFGPLIMFGLGGIYVEALKDVVFRLAPVRELSVKRMIQSIRAIRILEGVRGEKPADLNAIADCLMRLSQLSCEQEDIAEMDINPLLVYSAKEGAQVIDARILLG